MKPWVQLDSAAIPGGGTMTLWQHVRTYAIRVGRDELMNSHAHGSEDALADESLERLGARPGLELLIGGLGMGFTTAAALRRLPADGRLTVAELMPAVIAWNRGILAPLSGGALADPRVAVHQGDVAELLKTKTAAYDAILLDVDNGPHGLTTSANRWLYSAAGLARARAALRPGGILAVWSAISDEAFTKRLHQTRFQAELVPVRAHAGRGTHHVIWFARRDGA